MNNNEEFARLLEKSKQMFATGKELYFDVDEFVNLIAHYIEQEDDDKVQKLFTYAENQHGFNTEIESTKAMVLLDCGQEKEALQKLHKLVELEPENHYFAGDLSFVYAHLGDSVNALFYLKRAIALEPEEEEETVNYICSELLLHENYDTAQKILEHTLNAYPNNMELRFQLGRCYNANDEIEKGIKTFKIILQTEPYSHDAWFNLGAAYMLNEQFSEAIEALDYALAIDSEFIEAYFVKAACLVNSDDMQGAIAVFEEIIQRDSTHVDALTALADCYTELNDWEQAENYLRQVIDIQSDYAQVWAKLAHIRAQNEDPQQAIALFQKALELESDNCDIIIDFATLLSALNLNDAAIALSKEALKREKYDSEIWLKYSKILRNNNEIGKAIKNLQQALNYVQEASIYYTLAELFVEQKKIDKALEYFEPAFEDAPEMAECFFNNCALPSHTLELFHSIVHKNR